MFGVLSRICHILGTIYYRTFLKQIEVRRIITYSILVSNISYFMSIIFAYRWHLKIGISDLLFLLLTDIIFDPLSTAMKILPAYSLIAKVTPDGIEATIFAFMTGAWNLSEGVISPNVGAALNKAFVGVTANDLANYKYLPVLGFCFSFLSYIFVPLIPLKS